MSVFGKPGSFFVYRGSTFISREDGGKVAVWHPESNSSFITDDLNKFFEVKALLDKSVKEPIADIGDGYVERYRYNYSPSAYEESSYNLCFEIEGFKFCMLADKEWFSNEEYMAARLKTAKFKHKEMREEEKKRMQGK